VRDPEIVHLHQFSNPLLSGRIMQIR
jgi:hypothetical protein